MDKCKGAARLRSFYLRQRKEGFGGMRYSVATMNDELEVSEIHVESILKAQPNAARFFLNWKLGCVGCGFARFCTLADVIHTYKLDEKKFLEEAKQLVVHHTLMRSSE